MVDIDGWLIQYRPRPTTHLFFEAVVNQPYGDSVSQGQFKEEVDLHLSDDGIPFVSRIPL
jgi:hypothetical protein